MPIQVLAGDPDGYVVLGATNAKEARTWLVEYLVDNDELDNFGICTEEDEKGFCDLKSEELCEACTEFLATVFATRDSRFLTAYYWKEM